MQMIVILYKKSMNKIKVKVINSYTQDGVTLVDLNYHWDLFTVLLISEKDSSFISVGEELFILFKETEVALSKKRLEQSIRNNLNTHVLSVERGDILSRINLDYRGNLIQSLITTRALEDMEIQEGDNLFALIKANDISILKL
jgi:molybdate transport system regulatory protein